MATKNQRAKREQAALLPPDPSTTPSNENKTAERTKTPKADPVYVPPPLTPEEIIRERYGISPDQTNIPKLLYALLCEAVSR